MCGKKQKYEMNSENKMHMENKKRSPNHMKWKQTPGEKNHECKIKQHTQQINREKVYKSNMEEKL